MTGSHHRHFALDLVRVTEAAALCASRWLGKGDGAAGLACAVDAVRRGFQALRLDGTLVIGDGEREWPSLMAPGEKLGNGAGPAMDVAIDPVEGVSLLALGRPNAVCVAAVAPVGSMHSPRAGRYMQKLVAPETARKALHPGMLNAPVAETLDRVARALDKDVEDLAVFVLDKPRHARLIQDIRTAGARILLHPEGDVAGALMAVLPDRPFDLLMGTGGAGEAVVTACALHGLGGCMLARLDPQDDAERQALQAAGHDLNTVFSEKTLARSPQTIFACTGISTGPLLQGVSFDGEGAATHSLVASGESRLLRYIHSRHNRDKLMRISGLELR